MNLFRIVKLILVIQLILIMAHSIEFDGGIDYDLYLGNPVTSDPSNQTKSDDDSDHSIPLGGATKVDSIVKS